MNVLIGQLGPADIFEMGRNASLNIRDALEQVRNDLFQSDLYGAIVSIGLLIALVALAIFLVQLGRRTMEGGLFHVAELIWPVIVIMLLSNNGKLLAQSTLELQALGNGVNDLVLEQTLGGLKLREAFQEAYIQGASTQLMAVLNEQCQSQQTPEAVRQCLEQKQQQFNQYVDRMRALHGEQDSSFWEALKEKTKDVFRAGIGLFGTFTVAIPASILLQAWQTAAQLVLEIALLLVSMFGPIAVGASLLPTSSKPLFAWLSGMFSLFMAKLGFNIIAGIGATLVLTSTDVVTPLVLQIVLAIFAPALALIVGSGSGIGMFLAFSYIATKGVSTAPQMAGFLGSKALKVIRRS